MIVHAQVEHTRDGGLVTLLLVADIRASEQAATVRHARARERERDKIRDFVFARHLRAPVKHCLLHYAMVRFAPQHRQGSCSNSHWQQHEHALPCSVCTRSVATSA